MHILIFSSFFSLFALPFHRSEKGLKQHNQNGESIWVKELVLDAYKTLSIKAEKLSFLLNK